MSLLQQLWADDCGVILSAEMVAVSTLGVIATTTGLSLAANAVNEELADMANAMRSLDQSYVVSGFALVQSHGHGGVGHSAWTAPSGFIQQDVRRGMVRLEHQAPSLGGQEEADSDENAGSEQTAARGRSAARPAQ